MRVIVDRPPMFDEINDRFNVAGKSVLFAWGDAIYNPMGVIIPPCLMDHEAVHGQRQIEMGVENWWRSYISSRAFRLEEEIPAHQAEYQSLLKENSNRNARRGALKQVAKRLSAPLYGRLISSASARKVLAA
jgi:hypothetical protein